MHIHMQFSDPCVPMHAAIYTQRQRSYIYFPKVCLYICMYSCLYSRKKRICVCSVHVCMHTCPDIHHQYGERQKATGWCYVYESMHPWMFVLRIYIHIYIYIYIFTHTHIYSYIYTHIYLYIHTSAAWRAARSVWITTWTRTTKFLCVSHCICIYKCVYVRICMCK